MAAAGLFGLTTHAAAQAKATLGDVLEVYADDAGCVTEPALRARVQRWLKPQAVAADVRVEVDAAASPPRFSVRRGGQEVAARSFDVLPEACGDRLDAIAIAVALAIEHATHPESGEAEPDADTTGTPDANANEGAAAAAATPPAAETAKANAAQPPAGNAREDGREEEQEPEETEAERRAARARRLAPHVYAGGGVMFEVLPELVPAFTLGADLPVAWVRLDLALLATTRSNTELDTGLGPGTLHANLLAGRALACAEAPLAAVGLAGCAGVGGGAALASGTGYMQGKHTAAAWLAGIARGSIRFPASATFSLRLAVDALFNIYYPQLVVSGADGGKRAGGPVGVAGSLELLLALP